MKHSDISKDKPMMEKVAKKAVKGHEVKMHGVKKMAKGGKTNLDMKKYGRGMAKVMNQRSAGRGR
jgi:hypothetical protein